MAVSEKIKAILGDDYTEDMTPEQVLEKLNEKNITDLSRGNYVAKAKYEAEENARKAAEKNLADFQKSQMTAEEKAAREIAEQMKAKDDLAEKLTAELNKVKAEKVFAEAGLDEEQYSGLAENISVDAAKSIVEMVRAREESARQAAKEEAMKNFKSPDPGASTGDKKLSEMSLDEQQRLRAENPAEYERLLAKK